jgi:cell division protein FtsQ
LRRRLASPRAIGTLLTVLVVLGAAFLWLRDSSLVAVRRVSVIGLSGPDASQIRTALITAGRNMTTLDVNIGQLQTAAKPYPDVKHLEVSTQFPHRMRITVVEQIPVGVVSFAGRRVAVAGDGTLLHDVGASSLPTIPLQVAPGGTHLTGLALSEAQLLAAGPYQFLTRISSVQDSASHGLQAKLRSGPRIFFGDSGQLAAKWAAATAVLADPGSANADYIDVTDPSRPAAGPTQSAAGSTQAAAGSAQAATGTTGAGPGTAQSATGAGTTPSSGG